MYTYKLYSNMNIKTYNNKNNKQNLFKTITFWVGVLARIGNNPLKMIKTWDGMYLRVRSHNEKLKSFYFAF